MGEIIKRVSMPAGVCLSILVVLITMAFNPRLQAEQQKIELLNSPYISPTPGEIPIIASTGTPPICGIEHEDFVMLKKCGFNLSQNWMADTADVRRALRMAAGSGVKVIVRTGALQNALKAPGVVNAFKNDSNVAMWMIGDEPKASIIQKWADAKKAINKADSTRMVFVNLLPPCSTKIMQVPTYKEYVDSFETSFRPGVWSYDLYPVREKKGKRVIASDFYSTFEFYSRMQKLTGRPFWAYCLSANHGDYPEIKESHLRFEAFSALAYGAQGINYWHYRQTPKEDCGVETRGCLMTFDNRPTKLWYGAQKVNHEIQLLKRVFLNSELQGAWHTGIRIPEGCQRLYAPLGPIKNVSSGKEGVLVTHLVTNDVNYIVIVNHDADKKQKISIDIASPATRIDKKEETLGKGRHKINLPAGGYVIISWNQDR